MVNLNSTSRMKQTLCCEISGMGEFGRVETTKMHSFVVNLNLCVIVFISFIKTNTKIFSGVVMSCFSFVLGIHGVRNVPQVNYPIIYLYAINVIYFIFWELTCHIQPSQPMCFVFPMIYSDIQVAVRVVYTTNLFNPAYPAALIYPCISSKKTGFRVVGKDFFQFLLGKHWRLRNSVYGVAGNPKVTVTERLANPVPAGRFYHAA